MSSAAHAHHPHHETSATPVVDGTGGEGVPGPHDAHSGHDAHAGHGHHDHSSHADMFRRLFWINLVLALPVVFYSPMIQDWFGYSAPHFPGYTLVAPIFGSIIFFYGGWPFLSGGWSELKARQPGMMLLIAMAISVAYGASLATEFGWFSIDFWWELAALIVIMLLGHWQEMKAIGEAQGALAALAELLPDDAERVVDGGTETVPLHLLRPGDTVLVRSGGRVPADGVVIDGEAEVDESMVSGESRPVPKHEGDHVVAGTVATDSALRVRVEAVGDDTALAGIQRLVAEAQASHSRAQALADRAAALLFYVAVTAAVITAVVWLIIGNGDQAVERTVTVLVIACPHALGLAIPLVISLSSAVAARHGILVKDRLALERMRVVDTVLFDKTGTLTRGAHVVTGVAAVPGSDEAAVVRLAAAAESDSEHPLAKAIVKAGLERGDVPPASNFRSLTGRGVEAEVEGRRVAVGGPALLRALKLESPAALADAQTTWSGRGAAVLSVVVDGRVTGAIALEDEIRAESRRAIDELHALGVKAVMITGDARPVAEAVAAQLGVDEVFAEVLPEDKEKAVAELQGRGLTVAMVGDGVNDAPALARADVGIAIGAGTDVAIESAGVVLVSSDPRAVLGVIRLSKATYRKMLQNLGWGAGYNALAIPLAAGALAWAGVTLSPAVGAILMSLSTIIVALNAQLLRRVELGVDTSSGGASQAIGDAISSRSRSQAATRSVSS
jgi:Cu2+-exporting ATPase